MFAGINYLAVIICTFFSLVLGFLWYTPILFGRSWMMLVGIKENEVDSKQAMKGYLFSIVSSFLAVLLLAVFMNLISINGFLYGMYLGAAVGILFIATTVIGNDIFERRPFKLSLINAGYRVAYFTIVGAILGVWQ